MKQTHIIKKNLRTSPFPFFVHHDDELWKWADERKKRTLEKMEFPLKKKPPLWSRFAKPFSRLNIEVQPRKLENSFFKKN